MAVFRIERTRDYTVMSNHHLRNHLIEGIDHNAVLIAVKGQYPFFLFSHHYRSCSLWRGALLCSSDRIILEEMS